MRLKHFYHPTESFGGYSNEPGMRPPVRFVSALYLENRLEYFDDTSQLCRTDHDNVLPTKIRVLALIVF